MKRNYRKRFGTGLVLSLISLSVISLLSVVIFRITQYQSKESVAQKKVAQASMIAEAGIEDAMSQLLLDPTWRTGFNSKPFAGGHYTVTLSSGLLPWVTSVGYSPSATLANPAKSTIRVQVNVGSVTYKAFGVLADNLVTVYGLIDSYDSTLSLNPASFEFGAHVWSNNKISPAGRTASVSSGLSLASFPGIELLSSKPGQLAGGRVDPDIDTKLPIRIRGNVFYRNSTPPNASMVEGKIIRSTYSKTMPFTDGSHAVDINDNLTGIKPTSVYNPSSKRLSVQLGQVATITAGTYYFNRMDIRGTLLVDTSVSTVTIFLNGALNLTTTGIISNSTFRTNRLQIYQQSAGAIRLNRSVAPVHAYIEASRSWVRIGRPLFGQVIGKNITVQSTGMIHFDRQFLQDEDIGTNLTAISWVPGTWQVGPQE